MKHDKLTEGPFGSNACYEQTFEFEEKEITTWLCFGSGFTTSTLMTKGSKVVEDAIATAPELYKALMHEAKDDKVWLPATITLPEQGMVFLDGSSEKNWGWSAVKVIELTKEEKESGKYPKGQEVKMDMQNAKSFKQKDFMDALEYIDFYKNM